MLDRWKKKLFIVCPNTGKIKGVKFENKWYYYLGFPILGILATLWILIRVIPKPSRLRYPCMKVAIPISSSFFVFLGGLITSVLSFHKIKKLIKSEKVSITLLSFLVTVCFVGIVATVSSASKASYAEYATIQQEPNNPMGEAQGIHPGRVVWVHDSAATNEDCDPTEHGHGWFLSENNNQQVIDEMLNTAIKEITNQTDITQAWDQIFKYHNFEHGKGEVGYQEDEKIFIKINATSGWGGNFSPEDLSIAENNNYGISETSPHLVLSLLKHLIDNVGIPQENIYIGDPMKHIYKHIFDLWKAEYPDIHYLDRDNTYGGREVADQDGPVIHYSDSGSVLHTRGGWGSEGEPVYQDNLYKIFEECEYLINVPTLKGHRRAGVTMFAKNHFGSHTRADAYHLHPGILDPDGSEDENGDERYGYGKYRVLVDYMGYDVIKKKNLIFLMDALWSAGHEIHYPTKWKTKPFNNDWSSSIFISQDPVAIESVGYDFLRHEYIAERHPNLTYIQMEGADDYLHQAADPSTRPEDITYDPEDDGTPIPVLGVHEHWNNPINKEYSRNLGEYEGIELVTRDAANDTQDDTVMVHNVTETPVVDGSPNDHCWDNAEWQEIGQTWIPYDKFILSDDFTGRYKSVWNRDSNRVYFLAEIKDDKLVDGYQIGNNNYYKFDVLEIFIDEDNSGGEHRLDQGDQNAENAFAYHINTEFPGVGNTTTEMVAMDQFEGNQITNYANHFPEFALKQYSHENIYEFSLQLYNENFDIDNPEESMVTLEKSKVIGLSMAYCDNDGVDEQPKTRDNFFGSVEVAHQDSNNHWINADHFGTIKLVDTTGSVAIADRDNQNTATVYKLAQNYPNPFNPTTKIEYNLPTGSKVSLMVFDMTGRKVATLVNQEQAAGFHSVNWNASDLPSGVYFYKIQTDDFTAVKKCMLIK